jgi:hypothetical protein
MQCPFTRIRSLGAALSAGKKTTNFAAVGPKIPEPFIKLNQETQEGEQEEREDQQDLHLVGSTSKQAQGAPLRQSFSKMS